MTTFEYYIGNPLETIDFDLTNIIQSKDFGDGCKLIGNYDYSVDQFTIACSYEILPDGT